MKLTNVNWYTNFLNVSTIDTTFVNDYRKHRRFKIIYKILISLAFWLAHLSDISEQEHFFYFCREICQIFYTKADYRIKNHQYFYLKIPIKTKEFISIILLLMTYCYEIITFAPLKIQVETNHLQNILVSENDNSFAFHFGKTSLVSFVKSEFSKNSFILFPKKWKKELCFMATNN